MKTIDARTRAAVLLPWGQHGGLRSADARLAEAVGLARSIDLFIVYENILQLRRRRPSTLLGEGQIEELREQLVAVEVSLVVLDALISPVQQRNLERAWNCKVIDRSGLILDIFGERAATREGVLQVELAHLAYQRSRLVRSWTHLERQRGGFGFLGGPGETQIEADRRLIDERLVRIKRELDDVRRTRGLHRTAREKVPLPVIALVGYTNAGKSTLFNVMTGASVTARDQLFATLDPTMRELRLPSGRRAILSDTVGFVSELPTELIAAFRATLEEVGAADIILHVRDAAHPDSLAQRSDVKAVLEGMVEDLILDADWPIRTIEVLNKIDLLQTIDPPNPEPEVAQVSAFSGAGISALLAAIDGRLSAGMEMVSYTLDQSDGARLSWLYDHGEVISRNDSDEGIRLQVRLFPSDRGRFERHTPEDNAIDPTD